ncbi:MAG TPA: signal peptide peptidase SppA [Candidatus Nanoarchaeia archaeon]|nr:signal peptide peptidase SppA [Candidatus Nanoarchaeia archaeon]
MKKVVLSRRTAILLTLGAVLFVLFFLLPISLSLFSSSSFGNVALIPIEGAITTTSDTSFGQTSVSSADIVQFIEDAEADQTIDAIVLEINSPGGTPVASDEIAQAVKKAQKPVIAVIKDIGASGGYWVASATDYIFANRMSITGSIVVISSYLEFSGLLDKYDVRYERLVSGENKDIGSPFNKLNEQQRELMQGKIDTLHEFFVEEVALNRDIPLEDVRSMATGEIFLGSEALQLGLIDELGNLDDAKSYLQDTFGLASVDFIPYVKETGFFESLMGLASSFSFTIGEGLGTILVKRDQNLFMI